MGIYYIGIIQGLVPVNPLEPGFIQTFADKSYLWASPNIQTNYFGGTLNIRGLERYSLLVRSSLFYQLAISAGAEVNPEP